MPSSPQDTHRHSIDDGISVRITAMNPGQARRPGRRRQGRALTHGRPACRAVAPLEPPTVDEERSTELRQLSSDAVLSANPAGDARCDDCVYYLEPTADLSYCWHPKLRILVGARWQCQWWDHGDS